MWHGTRHMSSAVCTFSGKIASGWRVVEFDGEFGLLVAVVVDLERDVVVW